MTSRITRRRVLGRALAASTALAAGSYARVVSAAPEAQKITPDLVEAARRKAR